MKFDIFLDTLQDDTGQYKLSHANQSLANSAINQILYAPSASYLIDYTLNTYTTANKKLEVFAGCSAETFMQLGLPYTQKIFHPDDWNTYCLYAFPSMLNFLNSEPKTKWEQFEFLLNYRIKVSDEPIQNRYTSVIQKSRHLNITRNGLPYLSSGAIDYSNIPASSNHMYLRVLHRSREVYQQTFISNGINIENLTPSEQKALKYRSFGYTYAEISKMLNNTASTVSNQLKSLKSKTGCHTTDDIKILATQLGLLY
ncbi:helix-turn-helix transcriptional regulator [Nubsella zeaxanthinifaciens]|uniref:helix-turn-helix transcriptional regulator n=1 Tax=Nubsella zeaxanthinifaciens TaxID=392412 RepID=UPI003CFE731C